MRKRFVKHANVLLLACVVSVSAQASKMKDALTESSLPERCKQKLILIADDVIGKRNHRVLEKNVPGLDVFQAFVLLSYNDQDTHLNFSAFPHVGRDGKIACVINSAESYELPANCQDARNSIFKCWKMLGMLDAKTMVMRYDNPRKKAHLINDPNARATAFLTQTEHGKTCLINKQQQNIPIPKREEE